jgi:hypothetical protein
MYLGLQGRGRRTTSNAYGPTVRNVACACIVNTMMSLHPIPSVSTTYLHVSTCICSMADTALGNAPALKGKVALIRRGLVRAYPTWVATTACPMLHACMYVCGSFLASARRGPSKAVAACSEQVPFVAKAKRALAAGAVAVIFINTNDGPFAPVSTQRASSAMIEPLHACMSADIACTSHGTKLASCGAALVCSP